MTDVPWMSGVHRSGNDCFEVTEKNVLGLWSCWNSGLGDGGIVRQRRPVLCRSELFEELVNNVLNEVFDGFGVISTRIDEPCLGRV